jgi:hypothetical protein
MRRSVLALSAIVLIAAATGCRMCAHPFDYCGPTYTGGNCDACNPDARAGSILSPPVQTTFNGDTVAPQEAIQPTPEPTPQQQTPAPTVPSDHVSQVPTRATVRTITQPMSQPMTQPIAQPPAASNRAAAGVRFMSR